MLQVIAVAFATVFLAELGDKSQLLALSLSSRYRRGVLLAAVLTASAVTVGLSVLVGSVIGDVVPTEVLDVGAGALFLVFAAVTLVRPVAGEEDPEEDLASSGGFLSAVAAMSVAELGDKTMLASLTLAATGSSVGVWVGGTLGMAAAGAIAVLVGAALWRRLRPRTVQLSSAALFAAVGIWLLIDGLT